VLYRTKVENKKSKPSRGGSKIMQGKTLTNLGRKPKRSQGFPITEIGHPNNHGGQATGGERKARWPASDWGGEGRCHNLFYKKSSGTNKKKKGRTIQGGNRNQDFNLNQLGQEGKFQRRSIRITCPKTKKTPWKRPKGERHCPLGEKEAANRWKQQPAKWKILGKILLGQGKGWATENGLIVFTR